MIFKGYVGLMLSGTIAMSMVVVVVGVTLGEL